MFIAILMSVVCPPAAIHEFPEDIFTKEQRKKGAVVLHALCVSISHIRLKSAHFSLYVFVEGCYGYHC